MPNPEKPSAGVPAPEGAKPLTDDEPKAAEFGAVTIRTSVAIAGAVAVGVAALVAATYGLGPCAKKPEPEETPPTTIVVPPQPVDEEEPPEPTTRTEEKICRVGLDANGTRNPGCLDVGKAFREIPHLIIDQTRTRIENGKTLLLARFHYIDPIAEECESYAFWLPKDSALEQSKFSFTCYPKK